MPDEDPHMLASQIHEMHTTIKKLDGVIRGNNGDPGLAELVRNNRRAHEENSAALKALAEDVRALASPDTDKALAKIRWEVIGSITAIVAAALAYLQTYFGG